MLLTSPVLEGSRRVLESLASLEKALTYCSATEREAAALPCWGEREEAQQRDKYHQESVPAPSPDHPGPRDGKTPHLLSLKTPGSVQE